MIRILFTLLALTGPATAQSDTAPFQPGLSGICALGTTRSAGCDAIRARQILDAAAAPWQAIGRVNFGGLTQRSHCTGTLVGERLVLTAAHCLYNGARKIWLPPESLRFVAGYQRATGVAIAGVTGYSLDPGQDPEGRVFRGGVATDWALLELDTPLGASIRPLPLSLETDGEIALAGYAGLRPHVLSLAEACGPVSMARAGVLVTRCPAMQGDSGAPLLRMGPQGLEVIGVLSAVAGTAQGPRALSVPVDQVMLQAGSVDR